MLGDGLKKAMSGVPASDESALRRLLHEAVQEVEPRDGTLEYLRRAVPARRARKRQAAVGMAAAALFIGTAIPALVHVSNAAGPGVDPSVAGHASQAHGGSGDGKDPAGGHGATVGSPEKDGKKDEAEKTERGEERETGRGGGATEDAGTPSSPAAAGVSACTAEQLGAAVASSAAPDSTGVVYGSFRVSNVSSAGCTLSGPGTVGVAAQGAADATRIGTARHAAGDPAAGLPDPSTETAQLPLTPGDAYEVRFAWVPSATCPTTGDPTGGGTGGPSPEPSPTGDTTTTTGGTETGTTDTGTGTTTQLLADAPADGSVAVTYTAPTGSGAATAVVPNACAGIVYWTGAIAGS
ncbi:hypothetical protein [Streptomyces ziwulingensis]|uniref:hypothetical protein n=1 Tax=Streptomyces ziwulingensis TaxID=1045501 RepID=UPI0031EC7854